TTRATGRRSPTTWAPDYAPVHSLAAGHRADPRPVSHHSGTARTACTTPVQALTTWMPHPRRMNDMAGTSTPYSAGRLSRGPAYDAGSSRKWLRRADAPARLARRLGE